ncbi:MAG: asparagine synthase (glutamine-hydrolyzing) [Clostridiales Family XIII bacterium]|jgi:asparagine synthase (glutamine-hydrolysing)|nr:asparagine synthase (glutamine-hydrolyzing) [Clostridiales Family XIII bacterium]
MCGFTGFIKSENDRGPAEGGALRGSYDADEVVREMAYRIRHRGPDQDDYYTDGYCALGFRRLSIIDIEGGGQPIYNEDGTKALVYNGEVYNYQDLRDELLEAGHVFTTRTDSETLLHGYEEWGPGLLSRLRGMFAFAIWDSAAKKLFAARDFFGIKPLYFYAKDGEFMFGSEIKSFLAHPRFEKELNEGRLPEYLCYEYIPDRETMFKHVYKVLNGEYILYDADTGDLTIKKYFEIADHFDFDETKKLEDWKGLIAETLRDSVKAHEIADVEVGCFISSGVDSSYVGSEVARIAKGVKAFTVGFTEEKYSEIPYAEDFAREMEFEHITNRVSAEDFFDAAQDIQWYLDEPLPNPSEVPLYFLAESAARYVKVVLSGEGADELFGGYPNYVEAGNFERYSKVPGPVRKAVAGIAGLLPDGTKGKRFAGRGAMEPWQRYGRANYVFSKEERGGYLKKDYGAEDPATFSKLHFDKVAGLDEPTQLQYVDMQVWMLYDILLKADRMSMAHSLELRVPYLDIEMLRLALKIPVRYRVDGEKVKIALREASLAHIPEKTAKMKKLGFPVPLNDWLRQDKYYGLVKDVFESEAAAEFFNTAAIMKLLDDHRSGNAKNMKKIWTVYCFLLWYDAFFIQDRR